MDMVASTGASASTTFDSDFFAENIYNAIVGCKDDNITLCQQLGNMCVLQLYDKTSVACSAYIDIAKSRPILSSLLYDR